MLAYVESDEMPQLLGLVLSIARSARTHIDYPDDRPSLTCYYSRCSRREFSIWEIDACCN